MTRILHFLILALAVCIGFTACIEDGFDNSPSSQPRFSTDTLDLGLQFEGRPSPTYAMTIHNPCSKQLRLSSVRLRSGEMFRINVDGASASEFTDVEIRPKDSIYVFVEATFPPSGLIGENLHTDYIDVVTNGVTSSVAVTARSVDGIELKGFEVDGDVTFTADRPYLVTDTLRVVAGATLTLAPGTSLLFHDRAAMVVEGVLRAEGSVQAPVVMRGDRTGSVVADISYDVMSNQWEGVRFAEGSRGNMLSHVSIVNTCQGVALDSLADITLINCRLANSGSVLLTASDSTAVTAVGCELSNARDALALLAGGNFRFDRCTLANWYLFSYPSLAIVEMPDPAAVRLDITNSVIYGRGAPVGFGVAEADEVLLLPIYFRNCMFAVGGEDDDNFQSCIWETDPMLDYSLTDYLFPYTPLADSPVLDAADPALDHPLLPQADPRGVARGLTLGAYSADSSSVSR